MSVELQVRTSTLDALVKSAVWSRLRRLVLDPVDDVYLDHVDVSPTPVDYAQAGAAVRIGVTLDVFAVRRADLTANGQAGVVGQAVLVLEMAADGAEVSVRCVDFETPVPVPAARQALVDVVGVVFTFALGDALNGLGLPPRPVAVVERVGDVVAVRFDAVGPAAPHIANGDDWCLFLDGPAVERLSSARFRDAIAEHVPAVAVTPRWRPQGGKPHVETAYSGKATVPNPFTAFVDGTIWCDYEFTTPPYDTLRVAVVYSVHVDLGPLSPGSLESAVEGIIAERLDPALFGGRRTGPTSFTVDQPLPRLRAPGGVQFWYGSLTASPAGMSIGGSVFLGAPPRTDTARFAVARFGGGGGQVTVFCSQGATADTTVPPPDADSHFVGTVRVDGGGRFGGVEVLTAGVGDHVGAPAPGTVGEVFEVAVDLDARTAAGIAEPVRLVVRTARGVRVVDFGAPRRPAANEEVVPPEVLYIDDCVHEVFIPETVEEWRAWWEGQRQRTWGVEAGWDEFTRATRGFTAQVVTLGGLEPGELVRLRTPAHLVEVGADQDGRAVVPVLVRADAPGSATLARLNRQPLAGRVTARQAQVFVPRTSVPAGRRNAITGVDASTALVLTEFDGRLDVHEVGPRGTQLVERQVPVPDGPPVENVLDLPGLVAAYPVPGLPDAPVAIAELVDGDRLVLDLGGRAPRVAGTFDGPIGRFDVAGNWAICPGPESVAIFRRYGTP